MTPRSSVVQKRGNVFHMGCLAGSLAGGRGFGVDAWGGTSDLHPGVRSSTLDRHDLRACFGYTIARASFSRAASSFASSIDQDSRNPLGIPKNEPAATSTPDSLAPRSIAEVRSP